MDPLTMVIHYGTTIVHCK